MKLLSMLLFLITNLSLAEDFGNAGATLFNKDRDIFAKCVDQNCLEFSICTTEKNEDYSVCTEDTYTKEDMYRSVYSLQKQYINTSYKTAFFFATIGVTLGVAKVAEKGTGCDGGTCVAAGILPGLVVGVPIDIVKSPLVLVAFGSHRLAQFIYKKKNAEKMMLLFDPDYKNKRIKIGRTLSEAFDNL